jgi:hypothetical protein
MAKRLLWAGTVASFLLFFLSLWLGMGFLSVLPMSPRGDIGVPIIGLAILSPIVCLLGPAWAWNRYDRGEHRQALIYISLPFVLTLLWWGVFWLR